VGVEAGKATSCLRVMWPKNAISLSRGGSWSLGHRRAIPAPSELSRLGVRAATPLWGPRRASPSGSQPPIWDYSQK
jgi:hypothetical protein